MDKAPIVDKTALIIATVSFLFAWWFFSGDTAMVMKSFFAALLTSLLAFSTYIILRWLFLAVWR